MKADRLKDKIDDLDELAVNFIRGEADKRRIWSLPILDRWFVLGLANIYSLNMLGVIAPNTAASFKLGEAREYRTLQGQFDYTVKTQRRIREAEYEANALLTQLAKSMRDEPCNADSLLELALKAIDILTGQNVYYKMYSALLKDRDFEKNALVTLCSTSEKFEFEDDIPLEVYPRLLQQFFAACKEDGIAQRMAALDDDRVKKMAHKIPPKGCGDPKKLADNMKNVYTGSKKY